ncbi:MAG: hypothetical protein ABSE82_01670 [Nitrososphaerales archaeon]
MSEVPISKAPVLGEEKEQWVVNEKYSCVRCHASFKSRSELMHHYDSSRHDKYSAWN